jgi:hypothetical protein
MLRAPRYVEYVSCWTTNSNENQRWGLPRQIAWSFRAGWSCTVRTSDGSSCPRCAGLPSVVRLRSDRTGLCSARLVGRSRGYLLRPGARDESMSGRTVRDRRVFVITESLDRNIRSCCRTGRADPDLPPKRQPGCGRLRGLGGPKPLGAGRQRTVCPAQWAWLRYEFARFGVDHLRATPFDVRG